MGIVLFREFVEALSTTPLARLPDTQCFSSIRTYQSWFVLSVAGSVLYPTSHRPYPAPHRTKRSRAPSLPTTSSVHPIHPPPRRPASVDFAHASTLAYLVASSCMQSAPSNCNAHRLPGPASLQHRMRRILKSPFHSWSLPPLPWRKKTNSKGS
ncbi:hypothetical protein GOBAR_AA16791 [Gossypium barbadense]|uniref:Uncharacterized protein n=1 Tax=Gossypium barbadense TaxID=3634 RepID=A0A2P5XKJ5_GOSBA|nr:hypothetical protein GOBAR_AA16791 [Gossypium barbadense]